jgi:diguanylate cyclase (GGDEF)-like protein
VFLARGLVRPILAIRAATEQMRLGRFDRRLASSRQDEIGDVARALDLMFDDLAASRRAAEAHVAELQRSEQHLANAQKLARLGSFEIELDKGEPVRITGSPQFYALYQLPPGPLERETLAARIHPDDGPGLRQSLRDSLATGLAMRGDFRIRMPDGSEHILHVEAQPARDPDGEVRRVEGSVQDVTDRRRAHEQIRYLAYHDALTGLGNRRLFVEHVELTIAQARRRNAPFAVLFLDLDDFKRINDTLGHSSGDELLRGVADRLVACVRATDLIARRSDDLENAVSRLGGDEFTLLVTDVAGAEHLSAIAQRVLDELARPFRLGDDEVVIGASIGIAAWPSDGADVEALLRSADSAMYQAKARGRGCYEFYDASMNAAALERLRLEERIRRALERGEFEMHYQPKVELATRRVTGYEALIRWRDPEEGLLPPARFIPVAEQCGLIVPLGAFVLFEVCRQLAAWQSTPPGDGRHGVPHVSVNLSAHQFRDGALVETVKRALVETGARPEGLELEITETTVMHDERAVVAALGELHELGVSVSLDDFGTGQSSLSYLRQLPVDTLKIDMSFVHNIAHSEQDARLTAAIVAMGKARGLCVVAEGVETEAQRELLTTWGCDEIQGFLISPAVPPGEVAGILARPELR